MEIRVLGSKGVGRGGHFCLLRSTRFGPLRCPGEGPQRLIRPKVTAAPLSVRSSVSPPLLHETPNLLLFNFPTMFIYYSTGDLF